MADPKEKSIIQSGTINLPYMNAYGTITKALERIKTASTPDRFTQDFLATKLGLKGGSVKPFIPFLKRNGFLNGDGTPTNLYKEFRNEARRPAAVAQAIKIGYAALYEINEYAHDLNDTDLKGVIVQTTGLDANSTTVKSIVGSFKALRQFANFEAIEKGTDDEASSDVEETSSSDENLASAKKIKSVDLKLGYTINLNLPATSDIAVFNAIFKSLRDNLLE